MLKRMLMGMFAVLAIAAIAATAVPPDRDYVDKSIENSQGFSSSVWIMSGGNCDFIEDKCSLTLKGYKDVASYKAGKVSAGPRTVAFKFSDLTSYSALMAEIKSKIVTISPFDGGTIKNTAD